MFSLFIPEAVAVDVTSYADKRLRKAGVNFEFSIEHIGHIGHVSVTPDEADAIAAKLMQAAAVARAQAQDFCPHSAILPASECALCAIKAGKIKTLPGED